MNDESAMTDKEVLLQAIRRWLEKQQQAKSNSEQSEYD